MEEVLSMKGVKKYYKPRGRLSKGVQIKALDGVDISIRKGEIQAVVGETGSGKSTLGRIATGLLEPTSGEVRIEGTEMFSSSREDLRNLRRRVQIIFQDPYASLNPRFSVRKIIEEPLVLNHIPVKRERTMEVLRKVGLTPPEDFLGRYPHELSGGQRQRVSIARSLIVDPWFIVADEPVSMLDASMRASFLDLISDIQKEREVSMLLISHDISIAYYLSDRINVLYLGKIVESGTKDDVVNDALHPYTKALIQSVPRLGKISEKQVEIKGNPGSSGNVSTGCRFRDRCLSAMDVCRTEEPELKVVREGHLVSCHLY